MNHKIQVQYLVKTLELQQLLKTLKVDEVLLLCQHCHNYAKNHSCPDFSFNTAQYLKKYNYVTLILTKTSSQWFKDHEELLSSIQFKSKISDVYVAESDLNSLDLNTEIAMYMFNHIKDKMTEILLELENQFSECISSPPGSCTKCDVCTKKLKQSCLYPETLRYSLESLGFMVSDIYRDFFDFELEWSHNQLPDYYHTCSCLFSKDLLGEEKVSQMLHNKQLFIEIKDI